MPLSSTPPTNESTLTGSPSTPTSTAASSTSTPIDAPRTRPRSAALTSSTATTIVASSDGDATQRLTSEVASLRAQLAAAHATPTPASGGGDAELTTMLEEQFGMLEALRAEVEKRDARIAVRRKVAGEKTNGLTRIEKIIGIDERERALVGEVGRNDAAERSEQLKLATQNPKVLNDGTHFLARPVWGTVKVNKPLFSSRLSRHSRVVSTTLRDELLEGDGDARHCLVERRQLRLDARQIDAAAAAVARLLFLGCVDERTNIIVVANTTTTTSRTQFKGEILLGEVVDLVVGVGKVPLRERLAQTRHQHWNTDIRCQRCNEQAVEIERE